MLLLYIPDNALREAVVEQMTVAKLGDIILCDTPQNLLKKAESDKDGIIIIDGDDKKATGLAQSLPGLASTLLVLGGLGENENVTETFTKPLRLGHFITRLRYYAETAPLLRNQTIIFGSYRLEPQNRRLCRTDKEEIIKLTEKETALLVFLGTRGVPATRQEILATVWGYDERIDTHTLETHIYQLRRKLDESGGEFLVNEAGAYRLQQRGV